MKARGLRNNNPGNLDHRDSVKWNGELPFDADIEPRFCRFESPVFGIRALCKVLLTYQRKYKVCTIAGIVLMPHAFATLSMYTFVLFSTAGAQRKTMPAIVQTLYLR